MTRERTSDTKRDVLGVSLIARDTPRDYGALVDAILEFYDALARTPTWFSGLGRKSWGKIRKFRPKMAPLAEARGCFEAARLRRAGARQHQI